MSQYVSSYLVSTWSLGTCMSQYVSSYLVSTWSLGMSQYVSSYLVGTWSLGMSLYKQANTVLLRFNFADSIFKTRLFQFYCLSFYGGALWRLSSRQIKALEVSYNNTFHRIWSLPRVSHTAVVHLVAELESVYILL